MRQGLANVETSVSLHDKEMLEVEINLEEIAEYIYTFKTFKSPGFDGLPAEWYQIFWYLIEYCFQQLVVEIFNYERLSSSQYKGVISLMYKSGDRDNVKDWRHITLLNVDYKSIV